MRIAQTWKITRFITKPPRVKALSVTQMVERKFREQHRMGLLLTIIGIISVIPAPHDATVASLMVPMGLWLLFSRNINIY